MSFDRPPGGPPDIPVSTNGGENGTEYMTPFISMIMEIAETVRRIKEFSRFGKETLLRDNLEEAEDFLMNAYQLCHSLPLDSVTDEYCEVLRNLVVLHHKTGSCENATYFLKDLLLLKPADYQTAWLAGKTFSYRGDIVHAFDSFDFCLILSLTDLEKVNSLLEMVTILVNNRGIIEAVDPGLTINAELPIWKETVRRLSDDNKWEAINILMGMSSTSESVLHGLAKGCGAQDVNVGSLLKTLSQQALATWGQKLAVTLLQEGASLQSVKVDDDDPPFVSLRLGLNTGSFELLKYILQNLPEDAEEIAQVPETGDSMFHTVVKSGKANTTVGETAIRILLNYGCRADVRDSGRKLPVDYLNPTDQAYSLLLNAAKEPEELPSRLTFLRQSGKWCMQNKAYTQALRHYNKGIRLASGQDELCSELAVFYSNRSVAYSKLDRQEEALDDAETCIANDPAWFKGYWRKGQILKSRGQYSEAFITFQSGYQCEEQADDDIACLVEAASVVSHIRNYQPCLEMLETVEKSAITSVIKRLSEKCEWWALKLLVLNGSPGTCTTDRLSSVAKGATANDVNLCGLTGQIKATEYVTDSWRYDLLCALLSMGASPSSLVTVTGDTPYHAALKIALHMEDPEVLEIVLNNCDNKLEVNAALDKNGDNLLHTLFKSAKVRCPIVQILADLLITNGVDTKESDRLGKIAEEYVTGIPELMELLAKI